MLPLCDSWFSDSGQGVWANWVALNNQAFLPRTDVLLRVCRSPSRAAAWGRGRAVTRSCLWRDGKRARGVPEAPGWRVASVSWGPIPPRAPGSGSCSAATNLKCFSFKDLFYFIFRQRGREGAREEEKHRCVVASHAPPTGDLARNPGKCPDWELNR
ncbi:hypothetical protein HJG60_009198 [Phyllostomus discolor]|uniref:Uncharacterized protein n=1 Tax=Phyllostomus discolor TaxID=89673 RepID=A0A833YMI1_9CHIR|nr:hypothetical protein HJG60_009198 [Phyllostomus discolor]